MKAISIGREYSIYDDSLKTHDLLPANAYYLRFAKMKGFYLEQQPELEIKEDKIYGVHNVKIQKVLSSFKRINRNLGIILSGQKGIGKSLFAKLLAKKAIEEGYPVIIVDSYMPGLSSFIEDIEQEVMVLFDEFDKTFGNVQKKDGEADAQDTLLSLFDGLSNGKKMFVVTCNSLSRLSDYLVNRPGRFHYHFRFDYPTIEEIDEYMKDKLDEQYWGEISKVKDFSAKVSLNYDCLRAIAFELNSGIKFEEAIRDLNIMNMTETRYNIVAYFKNGQKMANKWEIDLFDRVNKTDVCLRDNRGRAIGHIEFIPGECKYDINYGCNTISGDKVNFYVDSYYDDEDDYEEVASWILDYVVISRDKEKDLHYDYRYRSF